jgi:hypothetical protein
MLIHVLRLFELGDLEILFYTSRFEKERLVGICMKYVFKKIPLNPPFSKGEVV